MPAECITCHHTEPHSGGGLGVCLHLGCGCDGPVTEADKKFGRMWWEQTDTRCPDCGHLFNQHYPDCHKPCQDRIQELLTAILDLWAECGATEVKQLQDETVELCMRLHEEVEHG
jgi:hypothetical protein